MENIETFSLLATSVSQIVSKQDNRELLASDIMLHEIQQQQGNSSIIHLKK